MKKMRVFFNPAPMTESAKKINFNKIYCLIVNIVECRDLLCEKNKDVPIETLINRMSKKYNCKIIVTAGSKGAYLINEDTIHHAAGIVCEVVDSTGCGDTFIGYFIASMVDNFTDEECLKNANVAASMCCRSIGIAIPSVSTTELHNY
eukprot:GHVL01041186.1.p1 GENE.GHVL01041186.1~~GHVL01041186.1.p1  ORF type:complete len:148 (+),score=25.33 GHVL01041186.1:642-1085(+)